MPKKSNRAASGVIPVSITPYIGARERPIVGDISGLDGLLPALIDHLQRVACEGARCAWANHQQQWMESETGRAGWRAQIGDDTAHLINVLEELGIARFEAVDVEKEAKAASIPLRRPKPVQSIDRGCGEME